MKEVNPKNELRIFVDQHETQRAAAKALEIGEAYLSDLLNGNRECSEKVLKKLGLRRTVVK